MCLFNETDKPLQPLPPEQVYSSRAPVREKPMSDGLRSVQEVQVLTGFVGWSLSYIPLVPAKPPPEVGEQDRQVRMSQCGVV